jgi:hypothetical protein
MKVSGHRIRRWGAIIVGIAALDRPAPLGSRITPRQRAGG